jgi:hypothetical protein
MKKYYVAVVLVLTLGASSHAFDALGTSFGCLTTAGTQGMGHGSFGGGLGIADATSFFGTFTYGLSRYTDGRLKLGMIDADGAENTELIFGADFKWQLWEVSKAPKHPIALALGGLFEYADFDGFSVLEIGGHVIGSHPFAMSGGSALTPYGRLNLRLERISGGGDSESEIRFGLNAGAAWSVTKTINLYGELQLDGNDGLFLGADLSVM